MSEFVAAIGHSFAELLDMTHGSVRASFSRILLCAAAMLCGAVVALEGGVWLYHRNDPVISPAYVRRDRLLGWAPASNFKGHATRSVWGKPLYDVVYTVGSNGLRVTPPAPAGDAVLFFGCSFCYGEGLNDEQTLPYQVGLQSQRPIFNFGFPGYGPHQMLAYLESGRVGRVLGALKPSHAIYEAIWDHTMRASGKTPNEYGTPRYVLTSDGEVQRRGRYGHWLGWQGADLLMYYVTSELGTSDYDRRLFLGIVRRSRELLRAQYPGCQFQVLLWPDPSGRGQATEAALRDGGVPLHVVNEILPAYATNPYRYRLNSMDMHPNAQANWLLARYITANILNR